MLAFDLPDGLILLRRQPLYPSELQAHSNGVYPHDVAVVKRFAEFRAARFSLELLEWRGLCQGKELVVLEKTLYRCGSATPPGRTPSLNYMWQSAPG
jgi:hypothetical protein